MKFIITIILTICIITNTYAQKENEDTVTIYNRIYFKASHNDKAILAFLQQKLQTDSTVKSFAEIGKETNYYLIELINEDKNTLLIGYLKSFGITAQFDKKLFNNICTTPIFAANDSWNDMGYWNSLNQNILKEKQLMDSIYWLVKDNFWNNVNEVSETVDLVLTEIPNGSHLDLPTINNTVSWDYYRNTPVDFVNATAHGSQTAGVAFAKINNAVGAYNGDMSGMNNVKQPILKNIGINSAFSSKAALLATLQAAINETNFSGNKQVLSISAGITTGVDTDFDQMFNQADANGKVLFIIGAGNDGNPIGTTLSNFHPSVIVVQASDGLGNKASFSSYNAPLSFKGTGMRGLTETGTSGTVSWQGTSASAPGAAGAINLLWNLMPSKTASEIRAIITDIKNTTTQITNPSSLKTPALRIGYLIQNLNFDIVHDYTNPINMAVASSINLTISTHDIQGGTISNPTYFYQLNQSGAWIAAPSGIITTASLGVGTHKVKIEFDIAHRTNKCTEIIRSIVVNNVAVTPVKLTTFTANTTNCNTANIQWQTAQEQNSKGFSVEQSTNGVDFFAVSFVPSKGNGNSNTTQHYNFNTAKLSNGKIYFRLNQIDNDGRFEYSPVVSVGINCATNAVTIAPNPTSKFLILHGMPINGNRNYKIYDTKGAVVLLGLINTLNTIHVEQLAVGVYYLKLGNGESLKFIKN
ncbi:MAG: S8 family peptidase [Ferruginibacter sp.]|nr:S8 family serine peptidase [Ferruginibacter sp.]